MFNTIKLLLSLVVIFTSTVSIAGNCKKSCYEEARPYVDKSVSAERVNTSTQCEMRCANFCFTEGSIADIAQSFKGKPDDYAGNVCIGKMKADTASIRENTARRKEQKALEKEKRDVRAREYDRKHQKTMEAIRNPPPPQERTQTSQNNYPSDNTYNQDSSSSASSASGSPSGNNAETTEGVNQCVNIFHSDSGRPQFKNTCNFRINIKWCVESECNSTNSGRLSWIEPGGRMSVMADPEQSFNYAA